MTIISRVEGGKLMQNLAKINAEIRKYEGKFRIMIQYKGVKYNITQEPSPKGKGLIFQYSINLKEPLKRLNASTFQEARKKVEKIDRKKLARFASLLTS